MFGLCSVDNIEKFSLLSVSVDCSVRNLLVTCASEFVYKNDTDHNAEVLFSFPLDGSCVVYEFKAVVGGKHIVGVCRELEEAKNLYKVAKERGHKAALIERNSSMNDVFKCSIGNMPQNSEAKITLKFSLELRLSLTKSTDESVDRFSLCLPLILRPRYTPADYSGDTNVYHVTNKYDYYFRASLSGSKEIKSVFSNNHQLKLILNNDEKTHGQVTLESKYDGKHDLDIYIDYTKMKIPSALYEFGTSSKQYNGKKLNGAFYKNDVAMLNFLPEFEKRDDTNAKVEIIIVVDRSGSMQGSNIQHAKECLLIFLKSLPTNCKFQIYGFGSTFDKVFPHPQLYDDQSIERAMNYQRNLNADFGGTELMQPLKDLYSATLSSDYTRVVFLLTDGDVGNQDEVFKLVRQHNNNARLFTVGIGDGVSTSLVQKVAESGNGKAVFVKESYTLSSNVIELLDIALNSDQFTDCKIKWTCPNKVTVVMVPSNVGPVLSNYFLTIFCMIDGLKEGDTIKCVVTGNVNGKPLKMSLDVSNKDGICDDEFRVHRLLAKYKIDEMTPQIEDGKVELKKSLIELSLDVNMVTNYTTFVAIDPEAPDKALVNVEDPLENISSDLLLKCAMPDMSKKKMKSKGGLGIGALFKKKSKVSLSRKFSAPLPACSMPSKMRSNDYGEKIMDEVSYFCESLSAMPDSTYESHGNVEKEAKDEVLLLADSQNIKGFWAMSELLLKKLGMDFMKINERKPDDISDDVWMTIIIYQYLQVKLSTREKEWRLLAKKAKQWLYEIIKDTGTVDRLMEQGLAMI